MIVAKLRNYFLYNPWLPLKIYIKGAAGFVIYNNKRFTYKEISNKIYLP